MKNRGMQARAGTGQETSHTGVSSTSASQAATKEGQMGFFYPHRGESKAARCPAVPRHSACSGPAGLQQVTWAPSKKLHHHQLAVACGVARARERQHQTVPGHTVMLMPCNAAAPCPVFFTAGPARLAGRWPAMMPSGQRQRGAVFTVRSPEMQCTRHVPLAAAAALTGRPAGRPDQIHGQLTGGPGHGPHRGGRSEIFTAPARGTRLITWGTAASVSPIHMWFARCLD